MEALITACRAADLNLSGCFDEDDIPSIAVRDACRSAVAKAQAACRDDLANELAECVEALLSAFNDLCDGLRKSEIGINPNQLIERAEAAIEAWRNDTGDE